MKRSSLPCVADSTCDGSNMPRLMYWYSIPASEELPWFVIFLAPTSYKLTIHDMFFKRDKRQPPKDPYTKRMR